MVTTGRPRARKARHGLVPLSGGEVALFAARDEAARRRQRLLDVRDRERRIARQVTRRYRENLDRLRGSKARGAQLELALRHEELVSELYQQYQLSLQSMGSAHRNAREKLLQLLEQANDEARKWQFNDQVVAKSRSGEAIRSHDEEERQRLARRWEAEQNLTRLRDLAAKQRTEASEQARREREAAAQRAQAAQEAEKVRRENAEEEVVTMPRPHANDVVSYQFTRLHTLSTDPAAATGRKRTEVKVVRHNMRHPSAKRGVEEAVKHREEVDKRLEQRRREDEENGEVANARGVNAMDVVASRKGGEKAMEWLATIDKNDRKELSPPSLSDAGGDQDAAHRRTPESAREKDFARMFRISEEDSGNLSVFSAGSEQELEEMDPVRRPGDGTEWIKLKAQGPFSSNIQKTSAHQEPESDQPISSDSDAESEGDGRLELLKDFLEATATMKQRGKTEGIRTPSGNEQESPNWQPVGKRYTGHGSSSSTPRHGSRQSDENVGIDSVKPASATLIDVTPEQEPPDRNSNEGDSHSETTALPRAPPIDQREERSVDSEEVYTEQDSIELLEERLQEVLDLRLRRSSPTTPVDKAQDQAPLTRPLQSSQRNPTDSGAIYARAAGFGHYEGMAGHIIEDRAERHERDNWRTNERDSSVASAAGVDISDDFSDDDGESWGGNDEQSDRTSLRADDGVETTRTRPSDRENWDIKETKNNKDDRAYLTEDGDVGFSPTRVGDVGADLTAQQRAAKSGVEDAVGRRNTSKDSVDDWQSSDRQERDPTALGRHERREDQEGLLQHTARSLASYEDIDALNKSDGGEIEQEPELPDATASSEVRPKSKVHAVMPRGGRASASGSSRIEPDVRHGGGVGITGIPRGVDDGDLSNSALSDDVETLDGHQFVEDALKSTRESARYSHSLSSLSEDDIDASKPRHSAAMDVPSYVPINAYPDRVGLARRSSAASSIAQYSLPPSDLQSSLDDTIGDIEGDGDNSFMNQLVPMFPSPVAQRKTLALRTPGANALVQHDLPPNEPGLRRFSTGSNDSAGMDAQLHRRSRVHGSLSPYNADFQRSSQSSIRFEIVDDKRVQPGTVAPKPSGEPRASIADDKMDYGRRSIPSPGEPLVAPISVFTQYDLPDESDVSSADGGSLASSRVDYRAFRPSDSGSSHSSIGFAVQLALASGTRRRQKGDELDAVRRVSQSRIAPMQQPASVADAKRGPVSTTRNDSLDDGVANDAAEHTSRRYSSDSSVSVDGRLNYLAAMGATAEQALSLPLHLPPRLFGGVDMSKPPAPMQLMRSADSSSSSSSSSSAPLPGLLSDHSNKSDVNDHLSAAEVSDHPSRPSSSRSSWSGSEDTEDVYARLQSVKQRTLPAPPLRDVDMSRPPAPAGGFLRRNSSNHDRTNGASQDGRDAGGSEPGSGQDQDAVDDQESHRSSRSTSEKSDDVFEKLEAMKLHKLPAPSFAKGFDMSQPPARISDAFEERSRSSMSSESPSLPGLDRDHDQAEEDGVFRKLEALKLRALPAPPPQGLDMSKPPAPMDSLYKQYSILSSSSASSFSTRESYGGDGDACRNRRASRAFGDEEEEKLSEDAFGAADSSSSVSSSAKHEAPASRSAVRLHIPVGGSSDSGGGVSLADAFQKRHPRFHLRTEQHRQELERRRQEQRVRQQKQQQQQQQRQVQAQQSGSTRERASESASDKAASGLSEAQQELLVRLATGTRTKVSDKEMKERSRRRYQQLPEVVERRRQEEVLRRRRQRLDELREQEKARRLAQRERRQQQQQPA